MLSGIESTASRHSSRIKRKRCRPAGLVLAGLLIAGILQQEVYAGTRQAAYEEGKDFAADTVGEITEQLISGIQKLVSDAMKGPMKEAMEEAMEDTVEEAMEDVEDTVEEADAAKEAKEQARTYDFTLGFAGDICLADNYIPMQHLEALGSKDISDGIDPRYIEIMRDMDLMWINNEFVYSTRGEPLSGKAWTFCGDPSNVSYLKDLGVDIVGLANNHTFDFGEVSFLDTLSTLEDAGIPYVGAGRTMEQAGAPVYLEADGFTIAYVAASRAEYTIYTPEATDTEPGILWCYDNTRFLESIRTAAENADFVIALPHWGVEHSTELEDVQINGAYAYIDAGADAVIGAHPHILQGIEYYKGKPILYSLGNFWFDDYDIDTLVARLRIRGVRANSDADPGADTSEDSDEGTGADPGRDSKADSDADPDADSDADSDADPARGSLEDAEVELRLYPGTQSGVYTGLADTEEWKSRILQYLESISVNITIDEDGVVHEQD